MGWVFRMSIQTYLGLGWVVASATGWNKFRAFRLLTHLKLAWLYLSKIDLTGKIKEQISTKMESCTRYLQRDVHYNHMQTWVEIMKTRVAAHVFPLKQKWGVSPPVCSTIQRRYKENNTKKNINKNRNRKFTVHAKE